MHPVRGCEHTLKWDISAMAARAPMPARMKAGFTAPLSAVATGNRLHPIADKYSSISTYAYCN